MTLAAVCRAPDLRGEQLSMLTRQLRNHAGIRVDSTRNVVAGCIQERMAYLGVSDIDAYLAAFDDSMNARAEWLALLDLLTIKETRFFRQPAAYDGLAEYVDDLMSSGSAGQEFSFWSAGCSYGQELYSMAMVVESVLSQHKPWLDWHGIGTDISFKAISNAQRGVYADTALKSLPRPYRNSFMEQKLGDRMKVCDTIGARTHFFHSNLLHIDSAPFADFNVIFCQNVLIYFGRDKQRWIINQLVSRLRVGGLLVLGAGEDAGWLHESVCHLKLPGVSAYKKIGD